MSKLTDFKLLSFDVYGTLVDFERGQLKALEPLLKNNNKTELDPKEILEVCSDAATAQQRKTPRMKYKDLLAACYPVIAEKIGCQVYSQDEAEAFGAAVGTYPAFPDTVDALKRLTKFYKLVVLSNVDNESFIGTQSGPLENFPFDAVFTAEDIGSYKPSHANFEYMFKQVKEKFGIERTEVLQTAQSQFHDHHPAREIGLKSCWIWRPESVKGNRADPVFDWKFDTLADMADKVEEEARTSS